MVMTPKANVMNGRSQCEPFERLTVHLSSKFLRTSDTLYDG